MGAWGYLSFQNDVAVDWMSELAENPHVSFIRQTFDVVLESPHYIEADLSSAALAAVEFLTIISGNRPYVADILPVGISISKIRQKIDVELIAQAGTALQIIKDLEHSEIAQLWHDSPDYANWVQDVDDLATRIKLPMLNFQRPRIKRPSEKIDTFSYPSICSPNGAIWIKMFEFRIIDIDKNIINGNTQIMVESGGIFMAMGTNIGIEVAWKDDYNVTVWLRKEIEIRNKETRVQLGRILVDIEYVEK